MFKIGKTKYYPVFSWGFGRAEQTYSQIKPTLKPNSKILDIGSGFGHVSKILKNNDYKIYCVDNFRKPFFDELNFKLINGNNLPFSENEFDTSLLLTVLHHEEKPLDLLNEDIRVSKRVIIIEDIYTNSFNKYWTWFIDSLLNWQWLSHPHMNRKTEDWEKAFKDKNLKIAYKDTWTTLIGGILPIKQVLFCVEK